MESANDAIDTFDSADATDAIDAIDAIDATHGARARTRPSSEKTKRNGRSSPELRRAYCLGVEELESFELIRFLFGNARAVGEGLLDARGLDGLSRATPADLERRHGLTPREAVRFASAFELGRRVARSERVHAPGCHSAEAVFRVVAPIFAGLERERFVVLLLDGKHRLQRVQTISEGTLTTSLVHPREVFCAALRETAAAIVAAHNHPSGDPEPSAEDIAVTRRLRRVGRLVGVPLIDHLVVGTGSYVSLRERLW